MHFELVSDKALIEAAHNAGHDTMIPTFERHIGDEEEMVNWLDQNLARTVGNYMLQPANV